MFSRLAIGVVTLTALLATIHGSAYSQNGESTNGGTTSTGDGKVGGGSGGNPPTKK